MNTDELKLCNCAGCNKELLGESMRRVKHSTRWARDMNMEFVAGRVYGRPYCEECLAIRRAQPPHGLNGESR